MMYPAGVSLLSVCLATALVTDGQDALTSTQSAATAVEAPSIDDFAWLAGHWRGEGLGGVCEEVWSQPLAGTMMGSFRLVVNGEIQFYELMVLGEDAEGMALKVKHFDKDFIAWEDKEDAIRFRFESVEPNDAKFSGLTMNRDGDKLDLRIRLSSAGGMSSWRPISFKRSSPDR